MDVREKQPLTFRHEWKHLLHRGEVFLLSRRLGQLFERDRNAGPDGSYRVVSLYFDTPYDDALREKVNGADRREKFRLRYYGEPGGFFRLEKKIKQHGLCGKRSVGLSREQAERLLSGDGSFLAGMGPALAAEFGDKLQSRLLRPAAVVCYDREAFVYPAGNVRVTIDRELRTSLPGSAGADFLHPERLSLRVSEGLSVLEVKYDQFLPDLVRMAVQLDRQASACSKYAACRRYE